MQTFSVQRSIEVLPGEWPWLDVPNARLVFVLTASIPTRVLTTVTQLIFTVTMSEITYDLVSPQELTDAITLELAGV